MVEKSMKNLPLVSNLNLVKYQKKQSKFKSKRRRKRINQKTNNHKVSLKSFRQYRLRKRK